MLTLTANPPLPSPMISTSRHRHLSWLSLFGQHFTPPRCNLCRLIVARLFYESSMSRAGCRSHILTSKSRQTNWVLPNTKDQA